VVGDASRATAQNLIGQFFGDARAAAAPESAIAPEVSLPEFKTQSRRFPTENKILLLAFRAPGIANPMDVVAADALLAHWKEGSDARLRPLLLGAEQGDSNAETANKDTPALGFDVDFLTQRDPGLLTITLVVGPQTTGGGKALDVVMNEIERTQNNGLSDEELARAKAALARQYIQQSDSVSGQAGALGFYDMIADYKFAIDYLDMVARVTSEDIKGVANKYLSRTSYVQVIAEPTARPKGEPDEAPGASNAVTASVRVRVP
jgi:predicted Zn-dependent peptidase